MKNLTITIFLLVFVFACQENKKKNNNESNTLKSSSSQKAPDDWVSLFDGETKTGWHIYNNKSYGAAWEVTDDGVLHLNPKEILITPVPGAGDLTQAKNGGDLATDQEYDNFHLKLEWKVASPSNSGVMIFVHETSEHDYPWQTGPEIQIMEQRACNEEINCVGDLYNLVAGPRDLEISQDWNQLEVIANNNSLEVIMNGRILYKTSMWDDHWRALIASTKFTFWPNFGTYKKGKIVLQDHGHPVWYRNIKIKQL